MSYITGLKAPAEVNTELHLGVNHATLKEYEVQTNTSTLVLKTVYKIGKGTTYGFHYLNEECKRWNRATNRFEDVPQTDADYVKINNQNKIKIVRMVTQPLLAKYTLKEIFEKSVSAPPDLLDFCNYVKAWVDREIIAAKQTLDLFLEYAPNKDRDMKFLSVPRYVSYGNFVSPPTVGEFSPQVVGNDVIFVDKNGVEHPHFRRDMYWLNKGHMVKAIASPHHVKKAAENVDDVPF